MANLFCPLRALGGVACVSGLNRVLNQSYSFVRAKSIIPTNTKYLENVWYVSAAPVEAQDWPGRKQKQKLSSGIQSSGNIIKKLSSGIHSIHSMKRFLENPSFLFGGW